MSEQSQRREGDATCPTTMLPKQQETSSGSEAASNVQPADAAPQEWTGDYVADQFKINAWDICEKIADVHNAELAAAENAADEFFRANGVLTQQLAAEREVFERRVRGSCDSMDGLTKELAAERNRTINALERIQRKCQEEINAVLAKESGRSRSTCSATLDWPSARR